MAKGAGRNRRIQEVTLQPGFIDMRHFGALSQPAKSVGQSDRPYKSKFVDAFDLFGAYRGVKTKHTLITFDVLRRMAAGCEPMTAIVRLRCNQAGAFCRLPRYESDTGLRITTRDPDQKVKSAEKKEIKRLQNFLLDTGFDPNPDRKDNLDAFVRKVVRDSLILDAYAFELVPGKNAKKNPIAEFYAIDAATIKFAEEENYHPQIYHDEAGEIAYIQEIDGRVVAEYLRSELAYGIRNPATDISSNGYGCSELENAINTITGILMATQYNRSYFANNSTPRGILSLVGNYSPEDLEAFKRAWRAQLEGASNAWRVPILGADEGNLTWIPLDQKGNRDMEFHLWLDFQLNVLCALYCVNPEELGFQAYSSQSSTLNEANPESKIESGKDKGLEPLMVNVANTLNKNVVWVLNEEFSLEWAGLGSEDKLQKQQYFLGYLNGGVMTVNEVRTQALDMTEIDEDWADAPANATLAGIYSQGKQQELMQQQGGMPGAATAGGPMQPPSAELTGPTGEKPAAGPPKPNFGPPPKAPGAAPGPPMPGAPAGPPKPFGKSLTTVEIEIEIEE